MKKIIIVILLVVLVIEIAFGIYIRIKNNSDNNNVSEQPVVETTTKVENNVKKEENIDELWEKNVSKYMLGTLWDDSSSYAAGHTLLVPMYYAFSKKDKEKIEEFHNLFSRYADYLEKNDYNHSYWDLNHMQFNFVASNYINLCVKYDDVKKIPKVLLDYLYDEAFYYSSSQRQIYKNDVQPFYNAFVAIKRDFELEMPISDLYQYHLVLLLNLKEFSDSGNYPLSEERKVKAKEALDLINTIYEKGVTFIAGEKWLMSVGSWDEHEDFAYMHYYEVTDDMVPSVQKDTTWDTSHFARVPVFLQIIRRANKENDKKVLYYEKLIHGLKRQFMEKVVVKPTEKENYYKTTNYMDGRNGLYRYNYKGRGTVYLPYELSGTMMLGWWSFLGYGMQDIYYDMYTKFPLSNDAIELYSVPTNISGGKNITRVKGSYIAWPNYFENGFAELICLLASKLNIDEIFN